MKLQGLSKTSILLTSQVVVSGITLFILYRFIYHTLGPVNLGLWSLVLATTGVARFTDLGLSGSLGRFVARYRALNDTPRAVLAVETGIISVVVLVSGLAVLAFPLLRIALAKVVPHANIAVGLALLPYAVSSLVVSSLSSAVQGSLDGCGRLDLRATLAIAGNTVFVILAIILCHFNGLIGLAWAQLIQAILLASSGWIVLRRILPGVPPVPHTWRKAAFREMIGYSTSYQISGIAMLLCEPVTKGLLARYAGLADVGLYEMASRVASQFRGLITAPQQSILPLAAAANEKGRAAVVHLYETAVESMSAMLLPALAVLIASAPLISMLWLGKFNGEFVHLLLVLALAVGLQTFIGPAYFSLLGVGSAFWIAAGGMTTGICNLLFGVTLAHYFGLPGVIAGAVAALFTGSAVIAIRFHKDYTVPWSIYASKANAYGVPLVAVALLIEAGIEAIAPGTSWSKWAPWVGPLAAALLAGAVTLARFSSGASTGRSAHQTPQTAASEAIAGRRSTGWTILARIGAMLAAARRKTPGFQLLSNALRGMNWLYWRTCLGSLGERTVFFKGVTIHNAGLVEIGSGSSVGDYVQMWGNFGVSIGNDVLIAAHVVITSATHDQNSYPYSTKVTGAPVVIEDGVWIGSGAIILPGVRVGARSIIGAGAVVTRDVAAGVIAVGSPARFLRSIPCGQELLFRGACSGER